MIRLLEIAGQFKDRYELKSWMGTAVRGVFGFVLRKLSCNKPRMQCSRCKHRFNCPYAIIFETDPALFSRLGIGYKLKGITKPYVLSTLHMRGEYRFVFNLALIGQYAKSQEYLIVRVLHEMGNLGLGRCSRTGERRQFVIKHIRAVNFLRDVDEDVFIEGDAYTPFTSTDREADVFEEDITAEAERITSKQPRIIKVEFRTPTMIIKNGTVAKEIPFSALIKNIMRKLTFIRAYFFREKPLRLDYVKSIAELAEQVSVDSFFVKDEWINKYSIERRKWERIGPFVKGVIIYKVPSEIYKSDLAVDLYKMLIWGRLLHVGKMTTAGAGEYTFNIF